MQIFSCSKTTIMNILLLLLSGVPFGQLSCPFENLQGNCVPGCVFENPSPAGSWTQDLEVWNTALWPLGYSNWFPCRFSMGKIVGRKAPLTVCCVHCSHNLFNSIIRLCQSSLARIQTYVWHHSVSELECCTIWR